MKIKAKVTGFKELNTNLQKLMTNLDMNEALEAVTDSLVVEAKRNAPIESGALRASITGVPTGSGKRVGRRIVGIDRRVRRVWTDGIRVPVTYAKFIEFGSGGRRARPFLRDSLENHRRIAAAMTGKSVSAQIKKIL